MWRKSRLGVWNDGQDAEFSHGISRGMVAKIASDEKKPDGQTRIQPSREVESEFFGKLKGSLGSLREAWEA